MAVADRILSLMKASAEEYARAPGFLSVRAAKLEVATFFQSEKTEQPPDDTLEYLAGELVRLSLENRAARRAAGWGAAHHN